MFLSDKTSEALDEVVGAFFDLNRSFDRACSVMMNKWSMPQASDIIHHKLAHLWPLMADVVSGFKDEYNVLTYYPQTHADGRDYSNLFDMMETLLKETGEVYDMIKMTYGVAKENGDLNANAMLQRLTRLMTVAIGQVITLRDKAEQLSVEFDQYDRHITSWHIDGVNLDTPNNNNDDD